MGSRRRKDLRLAKLGFLVSLGIVRVMDPSLLDAAAAARDLDILAINQRQNWNTRY